MIAAASVRESWPRRRDGTGALHVDPWLPGRVRILALVLLAVSVSGCGTKPPPPPAPNLSAIIERHTKTQVDLAFDQSPEVKTALTRFLQTSANATTVPAMTMVWESEPVLAGLKVSRVIQGARNDGDFESQARAAGFQPGTVPDSIWIAGFRTGVSRWLEENR